MTKQYITGAYVLRALADGKKVRGSGCDPGRYYHLVNDRLVNETGAGYSYNDFSGQWEIVEEPATDAELIAEMRNLAEKAFVEHKGEMSAAYSECAEMLEKRSIK